MNTAFPVQQLSPPLIFVTRLAGSENGFPFVPNCLTKTSPKFQRSFINLAKLQ